MNTEQDREALIADAREWPRDGVNEGPLINALADAIEALVKERDELAAVIEKARGYLAGYESRWGGLPLPLADIHYILSTAPADGLREHNAALIESLAYEAREALGTEASGHTSTYSVRRWLRERARQVREGEA